MRTRLRVRPGKTGGKPPHEVADSERIERTYQQAVEYARERMRASRQPVGVAVRRCWFDGEADGARALVVIVSGVSHQGPAKSVLIPRAWKWVDAAAVEDTLEAHAMAYPNATAMRELAHDIDNGSPALAVHLEHIWLQSQAA